MFYGNIASVVKTFIEGKTISPGILLLLLLHAACLVISCLRHAHAQSRP